MSKSPKQHPKQQVAIRIYVNGEVVEASVDGPLVTMPTKEVK